MKFKRNRIDATSEHNLLTGMIISVDFLKAIKPVLKIELLQNPHSKLIASWCLDYFEKYNKAPGETIQALFDAQKEKIDDIQTDLIESLLIKLSDEYDRSRTYNIGYALDQTEKYMQALALKQVANKITDELVNGEINQAHASIIDFRLPIRPVSTGIIFSVANIDWVTDLFLQQEKHSLFQFPGDLGKLMGLFCRKHLISFSGPRKRGKSFWLDTEIALRAVLRGFKTIIYSFEMTKEEIALRNLQWITARPLKDQEIWISRFKFNNEIKRELRYKKALTGEDAIKKLKQMSHIFNNNMFRIEDYPAKSMNVRQIADHLNFLEDEHGFIPDVIVVDYADLLLPEDTSVRELRHKLDSTWMALKGLAKSRNALVVTATHTNKQTLYRKIREGDSSEHVGKENHVDMMISLNQTQRDKEEGIMMMEVTASRHQGYKGEVMVLEQREIGKVYLGSRFLDRNESEKE